MGSWEVEETVCSTLSRLDTFYAFYTQAARQAGTVRNPGTQAAYNHAQGHPDWHTHPQTNTCGQADEGKDLSLQPQGHII